MIHTSKNHALGALTAQPEVFEPIVHRPRGQLEGIDLSIAKVAKFTLAVRIRALTDHRFAVLLIATHEHLFFGSGPGNRVCPMTTLAEAPRVAAVRAIFARASVMSAIRWNLKNFRIVVMSLASFRR